MTAEGIGIDQTNNFTQAMIDQSIAQIQREQMHQ